VNTRHSILLHNRIRSLYELPLSPFQNLMVSIFQYSEGIKTNYRTLKSLFILLGSTHHTSQYQDGRQ